MSSVIAPRTTAVTMLGNSTTTFFTEPVVIHAINLSLVGGGQCIIRDKDLNNLINPRIIIFDNTGDQFISFNIPVLYENGLAISIIGSNELLVSILHESPGGG